MMMTNKQTFSGIFFLIIILVPTIHISAQEEQSDATIEETINWINHYAVGNNTSEMNSNFSYNKSDNSLTFLFSTGLRETPETPLKWSKVKYYNGDIDFFKLRKSLLKNTSGYGKYTVSSSDVGKSLIYLRYEYDGDFAKRVFNAFKHLFSLMEWDVNYKDNTVDENKF